LFDFILAALPLTIFLLAFIDLLPVFLLFILY
jgi:hypothetical protein